MPSVFEKVEVAPPNAVFAVSSAFNADTFEKKVNMGVGAYRDNDGKPWVLPVVRKAEKLMADDESRVHEYLPIDGLKSFTSAMAKLVLGSDSKAIEEDRVTAVQCISGTGSLRIAMEFLKRFGASDTVALPDPTWPNHNSIIRDAGLKSSKYNYYDAKNCGFDFDGMMEDLTSLPDNTNIILHACAHNPTGVDPSDEQWLKILDVVKAKKLFPVFDIAYQGLASGDLDKDAHVIRMFVEHGVELLVCQSCSKNFGLYDERAGCLTCVFNSPDVAKAVSSQIKLIIRPMISNPPHHGARVVSTILNDPTLNQEWRDIVKGMAERILKMRKALYDFLVEKGTPGNWDHVINQNGMFTYTGLTPSQCEAITANHHIYLMKTGRVNMCGLNDSNVAYVANAIDDVVRNN